MPPKNQSRPPKSRRSFSRFSPGAILKGLQNPNEGQHVLQQKNGNRFNVVVSSVESQAETQNINLVPLRGLKPNEEIYRHETVIHPDRINRLFKKSVALTSQPYTLALPSLKGAILWGTIFSPELERIRAGIRIAMDAILRDFNKKPSYRRGDMILIEKNGKVSKGIVISNDIGNTHSPLLTVVSCSEETKTQNRFEMVVTNNLKSVRVKSHDIQTIDKAYVSRKIGNIPECEMLKITTKIHWGIGIKA
ncbi:MAG: type II toxin-antitoxin system PemK/MazF family toxin [Verrucomicrobia bacterium]|nr:type II toxin-antitoxin system PemK/MazF family toxin [Verrucomicrobiota bacterium]